MNWTNLEHTIGALIVQISVGLLTGDWLVGGVGGAAFFIGREHTQAEYRWISAFGHGKRV